MLHNKLSHSSGFSARLARANAGDPSGGLSESCTLTSVMLIHTSSSTEMAHGLLVRIITEGENHHPLIPAFQFFLCVLTRAPGPLLHMDHFLSFFTTRIHSHLFIYGPQHSREMGVSLMNYLPSTAARQQSAITISDTSTSAWEIRKWGTQRVSGLLFAQGQAARETEALSVPGQRQPSSCSPSGAALMCWHQLQW